MTRTHPIFSTWRERFYRERRKVVPEDIADLLAPLAVAVWLMDDGTAERAGVTFHTNSFLEDEVVRLADALSERYGLRTSLMWNKGARVVYVHGSSVAELRAVVAPHLLPELTYKVVPRGTWTP